MQSFKSVAKKTVEKVDYTTLSSYTSQNLNAELQYVQSISAQVQIATSKTVEGNDYTNFPQCFSQKL